MAVGGAWSFTLISNVLTSLSFPINFNFTCWCQSLRVASRFASRQALTLVQRRSAQTVPKVGSEAAMQAEAVEQIRARVAYQKELMAGKHGVEEDVHEMWRWINITFTVGIPICILSVAYTTFFDEHHHRFDGPLPEYMSVRSKEFPWQCGECDLFDLKCWKKCKAEK